MATAAAASIAHPDHNSKNAVGEKGCFLRSRSGVAAAGHGSAADWRRDIRLQGPECGSHCADFRPLRLLTHALTATSSGYCLLPWLWTPARDAAVSWTRDASRRVPSVTPRRAGVWVLRRRLGLRLQWRLLLVLLLACLHSFQLLHQLLHQLLLLLLL